jgi:hypothetical protein
MACKSCGSGNQGKFLSEVDSHFPRSRDVKRSPVLVYPELLVCLNCGKSEFTVPKDELNYSLLLTPLRVSKLHDGFFCEPSSINPAITYRVEEAR